VGAILVGPVASASAQGLDDQRKKVHQDIAQAQKSVSSSQSAVKSATATLADSQAKLDAARTKLSDLNSRLAAAQTAKTVADAALATARTELQSATAAATKAADDVSQQFLVVGQAARTQYQQQGSLQQFGVVVASHNPNDLAQRLQWSTTIFDSVSAQLDRLKQLQATADAAQQRMAAAEAQLQVRKDAADAQVVSVQTLTVQAARTESQIAGLVAANQKAFAAAQTQLSADKKQYASLVAKQAAIDAQIKKEAAAAAAAAAAAKKAAKKKGGGGSGGGGGGGGGAYTPERLANQLLINPHITFTGGSLNGLADLEQISNNGRPYSCGTYSPYAGLSPYIENTDLMALLVSMTQNYRIQIGVVTGYHHCDGAGPGLHQGAEAIDLNGASSVNGGGSTTFHFEGSSDNAFIAQFVRGLNATAEQMGIRLMVTQVASSGAACLTVPGLGAIRGGGDSCNHLHVGVMASPKR